MSSLARCLFFSYFVLCLSADWEDIAHLFDVNPEDSYDSPYESYDSELGGTITGLRMQCTEDLECSSIAGARCAGGMCDCVLGLKPNGTDKCVMGGLCMDKSGCKADFSFCNDDHRCVCPKKFHLEDKSCVSDEVMGRLCITDEDCLYWKNWMLDNAYCIQQECGCLDGWIAEGNFCKEVPKGVVDGNYSESHESIYEHIIAMRGKNATNKVTRLRKLSIDVVVVFISMIFSNFWLGKICQIE